MTSSWPPRRMRSTKTWRSLRWHDHQPLTNIQVANRRGSRAHSLMVPFEIQDGRFSLRHVSRTFPRLVSTSLTGVGGQAQSPQPLTQRRRLPCRRSYNDAMASHTMSPWSGWMRRPYDSPTVGHLRHNLFYPSQPFYSTGSVELTSLRPFFAYL